MQTEVTPTPRTLTRRYYTDPQVFSDEIDRFMRRRGCMQAAKAKFRVTATTFCLRLPARASLSRGIRAAAFRLFSMFAATAARASAQPRKVTSKAASNALTTAGRTRSMDGSWGNTHAGGEFLSR